MTDTSKIYFVFGMVCAMSLGANSALAIEPVKGFGEFNFGMPLSEVSEKVDIEYKDTEKLGKKYSAKNSVLVLDNEYVQTFFFREGKLRQVSLTREMTKGDSGCTLEFDEVFAALNSKYGNPDQPPERKLIGSSPLTVATFSARDLSAIKLLASSIMDWCVINVAYVSGKKGSEF